MGHCTYAHCPWDRYFVWSIVARPDFSLDFLVFNSADVEIGNGEIKVFL